VSTTSHSLLYIPNSIQAPSNPVAVVVLALGSHGVMNQVDHWYLTFCHPHGAPSFKEDREVDEDRLQLFYPSVPPHEGDPLQHLNPTLLGTII